MNTKILEINKITGGGKSSARYDSFNGLRALSAIGILLMHYLSNINADIKDYLKDYSLVYSEIIPFCTQFVFLFFIISAFSMCCGYFSRFATERYVINPGNAEMRLSRFDTEQFYSRRYSRILPFFALLVCIDFVMNPSMNEFYQCFADLTLAFNLLPNPQIEVIGVGWFLGVVFLFYMIFPWFVFLCQNKKRAWLAMSVAVVFHVVCVRYFLTEEFCTPSQIGSARRNIIYCFPFFMAGGLLFLYRVEIQKIFENRNMKLLLLILSLIATSLVFTPRSPGILGEKVLFHLIVFVLWTIYAMTGGFCIGKTRLLDNKLMTFIGGVSMEIYLCHMVIFRVIEKIHLENYITNPHLLYWFWCLAGIIGSILFSVLVKKQLFPFLERIISKIVLRQSLS
ncbi:MAG: acyltransferase [Bacteroides sp.]|nr:acyltransferase [Roseburia sp.]MCM1346916.1 acyltransferase [Bacteroides sp.]MCM1421447.1 acyltransferase [Bacteroides sp.]